MGNCMSSTRKKEKETYSTRSNSNLNADDSQTNVVNECKLSIESSETKTPSCQVSADEEICSAVNKLEINSNSCVSYETEFGTVQIDDNKLQHGSADSFHAKYNATSSSKIFETKGSIVFLGEEKQSRLKVAIKRFEYEDTSQIKECLIDDRVLEEAYVQKKAQDIVVENGTGSVLKMLDWYVYDIYFVLVTEYDEDFQCLTVCTYNQPGGHFTEDECKTISKSICKLVMKLHENGIFHMDIKPSNFLYNTKRKEIKLLDFGQSICDDTEQDSQIKQSFDMWGVARTLYFCLQGGNAFNDVNETLRKELQFNVEVSEECKDFIRLMLAYNVQDILTPTEIFKHPWLK